jgi:hypothetical protein
MDPRGGASEGGTFHPSNSEADEHGSNAGAFDPCFCRFMRT